MAISFASLATGIARGKVSAAYLGASGVGVVSQLGALSILGTTIALAGASTAATIVIGRAHGREDASEVNRLTSYVISRPLLVSIVVCGVLIAASDNIAAPLLGSTEYTWGLVVAFASVPLNVLAASVSVVLIATGRAGRAIMASLISLLIGTCLTIGAVVSWGLAGGIWSVLTTSVVAVVVLLLRERSWVIKTLRRSEKPTSEARREFLTLGVASFALSAASSTLDSVQRALLIHSHGVGAAGLFQAISMASAQGFAAVLNGVMLYLAPTLAALVLVSKPQAIRDWRRCFDITVGLIAVLSIFCILLAPVVLRVLFSPEFVAATAALRWQAVGEVLRAGAFVVGAVLLPLGARGAWLIIGLVTVGVQAVVAWALVPEFGVQAMPMGFAVGFGVNVLASLGWAHSHGWRQSAPSLMGLAVLLTALAVACWPIGEAARPLPLAAAMIVSTWMFVRGLRRRERTSALVAA